MSTPEQRREWQRQADIQRGLYSPNAIPALLDELQAVEAERDRLREVVGVEELPPVPETVISDVMRQVERSYALCDLADELAVEASRLHDMFDHGEPGEIFPPCPTCALLARHAALGEGT